jgi:hypothetical protein
MIVTASDPASDLAGVCVECGAELPPPPGFLEPYVDRRRSDGRPQSLLAAYRKFQTPRDVLRTGDYSDRIGPRQADLQAILQEAARVCATCLGAPFSKIWRYRPSEDDLLVVAGRGWNLGVVGFATSVADETPRKAGHSSPAIPRFAQISRKQMPLHCRRLSRTQRPIDDGCPGRRRDRPTLRCARNRQQGRRSLRRT